MSLDIKKNRSASKYNNSVLIKRVLWSIGKLLFRFSPRIAFAWRNQILKIFGAKIGQHVHIYNTADIYMPWNLVMEDYSAIGEHAYIYNLAMVRIGRNSTVSQRSHLCTGTHDYEDSALPLMTKEIVIGDNAWVCADVFVGPGVTMAQGSVAGARAVIMKDVEANAVMAGNPAKKIKTRQLFQ